MKDERVYITSGAPRWKSLDYKKLREEGIAYIQQYSGDDWTDFNHHDPGVTILEYLCYGITDLGYRCNLPITDFLYARENHRPKPANNAFYLPEKIFPCAPLTIDDYRKLIIDHFDTIENVWMEPVLDQKDGIKGLFKILLQLREDSGEPHQPDKVRGEVLKLLSAHRNLGNDFHSVEILQEDAIEVSAKIELEGDVSCEQVLAEILISLVHYFTPPVQIDSFESKVAAGALLEDIFDGPEPLHGFIDPASLRPLMSVIYISRIKDLLISTPGVKNVQNLVVRINDIQQFSEEIRLRDFTYLGLSDAMTGKNGKAFPFRFERNGKVIEPIEGLVNQTVNSRIARENRKYNLSLDIPKPPQQSNKELSDIGAYYSIQRFFPAVYGIGAYGMPLHFTHARKISARRLKGYLACMEFLFADYLNSLTELKHLFSIDIDYDGEQEAEDHPDRSSLDYLMQRLADIPDMTGLWNSEEIQEKAASNPAEPTVQAALARHHLFIDHLLARFGENIDAGNLVSPTSTDKFEQYKRLLTFKQRILQEYVTLSRDRGLGFDYSVSVEDEAFSWKGQTYPGWKLNNVSGLKKRLCYWLSLEAYADRGLTDFKPFDRFFDLWQPESGTTVQQVPLRPLLKRSQQPDWFDIQAGEAEEEGVSAVFKTDTGQQYTLFHAESEADALEKLQALQEALAAFNERSKGFFIVEHVLLRRISRQERKLRLEIHLGDQELVFQSLNFDSMENLNLLADSFLSLASLETNYEILETGDNQFFIVLKKGRQPVLVCTRRGSYTAVLDWRTRMIDLVNKTLNHDPARINDWISMPKRNVKGENIATDLYNHQISIVLPNWVDLFVEEDGRQAFRMLTVQHVPAHLQVMFHWLPWHKMQRFETLYKAWLDARQQLDPDDPASGISLDNLSFDLLTCLGLADESAEPGEEPSEEGLAYRLITDALFQHYEYDVLFSPDQLTIFQNIDKQTEAWLKKEGIYTWQLLASMSPAKQLEIYQRADVDILGMNLETWMQQAAFAVAGDWQGLETYQAAIADGKVKIRDLAEKKLKLLYLT